MPMWGSLEPWRWVLLQDTAWSWGLSHPISESTALQGFYLSCHYRRIESKVEKLQLNAPQSRAQPHTAGHPALLGAVIAPSPVTPRSRSALHPTLGSHAAGTSVDHIPVLLCTQLYKPQPLCAASTAAIGCEVPSNSNMLGFFDSLIPGASKKSTWASRPSWVQPWGQTRESKVGWRR